MYKLLNELKKREKMIKVNLVHMLLTKFSFVTFDLVNIYNFWIGLYHTFLKFWLLFGINCWRLTNIAGGCGMLFLQAHRIFIHCYMYMMEAILFSPTYKCIEIRVRFDSQVVWCLSQSVNATALSCGWKLDRNIHLVSKKSNSCIPSVNQTGKTLEFKIVLLLKEKPLF